MRRKKGRPRTRLCRGSGGAQGRPFSRAFVFSATGLTCVESAVPEVKTEEPEEDSEV